MQLRPGEVQGLAKDDSDKKQQNWDQKWVSSSPENHLLSGPCFLTN